MFGSMGNGASAYAKVGIETGVSSASPHTLVVMLYEGALTALTIAEHHMKSGHIAEKGLAISKAIMIIDSGLRASLNSEAGGEIALNLDALYAYMSGRLIQANLKNDAKILNEVVGLLRDLKNAWESIAPSRAPQPAAEAPTAPANGAPAAHMPQLVKA